MAQPQADWHDFPYFTQTYIPRQTIPYLKHFIDIIQAQTGRYLGLRAGDKKAVIVDKVVAAFTLLKTTNQHDVYRALRQKCEQVGLPTQTVNRYVPPQPPPTFGGALPAPRAYPSATASSSTAGWNPTSTPAAYTRPGPILADWKASPMWKPVTAITNMEMLPEITAAENSHVRKERKTTFTLSPDACEKMQQSKANPSASPSYSVRLFCTSSDYFRPSNERVTPTNAGVSNRSIPIEYPAVPDVRVDDLSIPFKERGLRGKAGSAPPFDMNKSSRGLTLIPNRLASVTFGHTGATSGKKKELTKKFYFQVILVEWTSKEVLQKKLIDMPLTPLEDCLALARKSRGDDDDIEVGSSRMSLKDPLSCMRITQPIRSTKCAHQQCFDATWWVESNATHPQWLCPFCNRELNWADLIADGFFFSILQTVPDTVEEVVIEPDGEWHSENDKFGSPAWLAAHTSVPPPPPAPVPTSGYSARNLSVTPPTRASSAAADPKGKRKAIEVLSSDDEDTPLSRSGATLPPSLRPSRQQSLNGSTSSRAPINEGIIDLTLSSDDEDTATSRKDKSSSDFRQPGVGFSRSATATASFRSAENAGPNPNVREGQLNGDQDGPAMGSYRDQLFDEDWDDELGSEPQSRYLSSSAARNVPPSRSNGKPALSPFPEDLAAERPETPPLPPITPPLPTYALPSPTTVPPQAFGRSSSFPNRPSFTVPHRPSSIGLTPSLAQMTPSPPRQVSTAGSSTSVVNPPQGRVAPSFTSTFTANSRLSNIDPALRSNLDPNPAPHQPGSMQPPSPKTRTPLHAQTYPAEPSRAIFPTPNPPRFPLPPRPAGDPAGRMVPTSHFAPQASNRQVVLPPTGPGQLRRLGLLDETIERQQS